MTDEINDKPEDEGNIAGPDAGDSFEKASTGEKKDEGMKGLNVIFGTIAAAAAMAALAILTPKGPRR